MAGNIKVLCTGSGGEIISNFLRFSIFNKTTFRFASIDNISHGKSKNIFFGNQNHAFHVADVTNKSILDHIFDIESPDIVIHATDNTNNIVENITTTKNIIDACVKWKVKRLLYISTDKVYGDIYNSGADIASEVFTPDPDDHYAISKYTSELFIQSLDVPNVLEHMILRLPNNYGPRQRLNRLIPTSISNILNNKKTNLINNGENIRDWIYYEDTCLAILHTLKNWKNRAIYNISSHQQFTDVEVYQEICNTIGNGYNLLEFSAHKDTNCARRRGLDSKLFRKETGWEPKFKFKDSIKNCVEWYMKNQGYLKGK